MSNQASFNGSGNAGYQIGQNYDVQIGNTYGQQIRQDYRQQIGQVHIHQGNPPHVSKEEEKEIQCLQAFRLSTRDGEHYYEWYKNRNEDRVPGTCNWFLEHPNYVSWKRSSSGPLLVSADPGCGKSVLTKYLVDHELEGTVCYFFFKDQDQNTIRQALCALLHQLFAKQRKLIKHAIPRYQEDGDNLMRNTEQLWKIFVGAVRDRDAEPVTVALDALDECDPVALKQFTRNLINLFDAQSSLSMQLKVLLTTRPYQSVLGDFWTLVRDIPNIRIPGEDHSEEISKEVDCVVLHRVDQLAGKVQLPPNLRSYLLERLLKTTHRTYLWIYLVFDHLEKGFQRTERGIQDVIDTLPESVNEAYEKILEKSTNKVQAKRTLSILLVAAEPLDLAEMNVAANVMSLPPAKRFSDLHLENEENFITTIRNWCGLFISIYNRKIYFLHQTAREFLLANDANGLASSRSWQWRSSIDMRQAHETLARICLTFLCLQDIDTRLVVPDDIAHEHAAPRSRTIFRERGGKTMVNTLELTEEPKPFFGYAADSWGTHFEAACPQEYSDLVPLGLKVCGSEVPGIPRWVFRYYREYSYSFDVEGWSPLVIAISIGIKNLIRPMLTSENFDQPDQFGWTPLFYSVKFGYLEIAALLVQMGADVRRTDHRGNTVSHIAIRNNKPHSEKMLKKLVKLGVDINQTGALGMSLLYVAIATKQENIAKFLIHQGAYVNLRDTEGCSPLSLAMILQNHEIVDLLLTHGADVNTIDVRGVPALHTAALSGWVHFVQLLLAWGADVDARDNDRRTPLHQAVRYEEDLIVEALLESGADANACDKHGTTVLDEAKRQEMVRLLLQNGANLDARAAARLRNTFTNLHPDLQTLLRSVEDQASRQSQHHNQPPPKRISRKPKRFIDEC